MLRELWNGHRFQCAILVCGRNVIFRSEMVRANHGEHSRQPLRLVPFNSNHFDPFYFHQSICRKSKTNQITCFITFPNKIRTIIFITFLKCRTIFIKLSSKNNYFFIYDKFWLSIAIITILTESIFYYHFYFCIEIKGYFQYSRYF